MPDCRAALSAIVGVLALWTVPVHGQTSHPDDAGGTTVVFQINQGTYPAPLFLPDPLVPVALPKVSHANLSIDTQQFVPNVGIVRGEFDLSSSGGPFTPSRGLVKLSEMPVGSWSFEVNAGDKPLDVYPLDLGLSTLYRTFTGVRGGVSIGHTGGDAHLRIRRPNDRAERILR